MIISDSSSSSNSRKGKILLLSIPILLFVLWFFKNNNNINSFSKMGQVILCDAEQIFNDKFENNGFLFSNGKSQSNEFAHTGNYSSKLEKKEGLQFSLGYELNNWKPGDIYHISVWQFRPTGGKSFLCFSGEGEMKIYKAEGIPTRIGENEWELLEIEIKLPLYKKLDKLSVYVYTDGKNEVYFDDLRIEKIGIDKLGALPFQPKRIKLELDDKAIAQLKKKRREALRAGLLVSQEEDWVNAKLFDSENAAAKKIKLRLKGDWLDHLQGDKWSFRIKLKGEDTWNRLRHFSIHAPVARDFLMEWILHEFWKQEDVLTTRYDFALVELNDNPLWIYAYEEHFEKTLLEFQKRREGPILRFSEDGFWAVKERKMQVQRTIDVLHTEQPVLLRENANIKAFKQSQLDESPLLTKQFQMAQSLLEQYRQQKTSAEKIFDIERMAKYYAICDAMRAYHGTAWHNERFYYNPVLSRLEPIGYDGFPTDPDYAKTFLGQGALNDGMMDAGPIFYQLFQNKKFTEQYIQYLYKYTSRDFLQNFLDSLAPAISDRLQFLQTEFKDYTFLAEEIIEKAQNVHVSVFPYNELTLKVYKQSNKNNKLQLKIANVHTLPVQIVGYGTTLKKPDFTFEEPILLEATFRKRRPLKYYDLEVANHAKFVFYKVFGLDSLFYTSITSLKMPPEKIPSQNLFENVVLESNNVYDVLKGKVIFKEGMFVINHNIVIPNNYKVIFKEGVYLDFVKGAKFISQSPVFMYGTADKGIHFFSSDKTAGGFTVLQAKEKSVLHHVVFDDFGTLDDNGWLLTGAVSFYESDVEMYQCTFKNAHCEDALNLVRSDFHMENCIIEDAASDGLDLDFCAGKIANSFFRNNVNDGIDISGSDVIIVKTKASHCGDKGLSVGEESDVIITSMQIENCPIALASKDLSEILIRDISLINCEQGFAAYQKKPEYGPALITVEKYETESIKRLFNIRSGSKLILEGKEILGE